MEPKIKINKITSQKNDELWHKTRVYIFIDGENIMENLAKRRMRPYNVWKKEVLPLVLKKLNLEGWKASWSQKAGCSCGCSPGFFLYKESKDKKYREYHQGRNIFVHIEYISEADQKEDRSLFQEENKTCA